METENHMYDYLHNSFESLKVLDSNIMCSQAL